MNKRNILIGCTLALMFSGLALAQLDPGFKNFFFLYENGARVGEVFVPERGIGQTSYKEHWVLYGNYQYPGLKYIGQLLIAPIPSSTTPYAGEADFFRQASFPAGSKYVEVTAEEFNTLPVAGR